MGVTIDGGCEVSESLLWEFLLICCYFSLQRLERDERIIRGEIIFGEVPPLCRCHRSIVHQRRREIQRQVRVANKNQLESLPGVRLNGCFMSPR